MSRACFPGQPEEQLHFLEGGQVTPPVQALALHLTEQPQEPAHRTLPLQEVELLQLTLHSPAPQVTFWEQELGPLHSRAQLLALPQ